MIKQTSVTNILKKTEDNWPESYREISPEILRIHRISHYLHTNLTNVLKNYHLQPADFSVLETLRKEPAPHCLTPTQLSKTMLFSSGGLTKVLNRLIENELILRLDNPNDNRGKLVQLTQLGATLIAQVIVSLHDAEHKKTNKLSINEKIQLNQLLEKMLNCFE
jgi:DNA-binding MarR family transcriptional regulator